MNEVTIEEALAKGAKIISDTDKYTTLEYPKTFHTLTFIFLVLIFFPLALLQILLYAVEQPKTIVIMK